jgi:hypothetical protein
MCDYIWRAGKLCSPADVSSSEQEVVNAFWHWNPPTVISSDLCYTFV